MLKNITIFLTLSLLFIGCTDDYVVVAPTLPQNIKKIAIQPFTTSDEVSHPQLKNFTDKLNFTIKDVFTSDRRITVVSMDEADAVLTGKISRYALTPIEFSSAKIPTKYMLWTWVDITFYDNVSKNVLWTEERLEAKVQYSTKSETMFDPTTETEAQNMAINTLAENIVKRTIDGWFGASGVSNRK